MDAQWLKTQFDMNPDKNKSGLAQALGLEPSAVSKILAGTREIKAKEYQEMRRYFGLPVDGERAAVPRSAYVLTPLASGLSDSAQNSDNVQESWVMPASILSTRTKAAPEDIRIFAVSENAMTPDLNQGEHVLVDLSDKKPSPPGLFVISDGMGPIIRQCAYVPHSSPPRIRLSARQERYEPYTVDLTDGLIISGGLSRSCSGCNFIPDQV